MSICFDGPSLWQARICADTALQLILQSEQKTPTPHQSDSERSNASNYEIGMLPIAYQNLAVELEHEKCHREAVEAFVAGYEVALRRLGPEHPVTHAMRSSAQGAHESAVRSGKRMDPLPSHLAPAKRAVVATRGQPGIVKGRRPQSASGVVSGHPRGTEGTCCALVAARFHLVRFRQGRKESMARGLPPLSNAGLPSEVPKSKADPHPRLIGAEPVAMPTHVA